MIKNSCSWRSYPDGLSSVLSKNGILQPYYVVERFLGEQAITEALLWPDLRPEGMP